ncbi:Fc.00g067580.m01.CDS01 [Cosmosporella sp. VM-42]
MPRSAAWLLVAAAAAALLPPGAIASPVANGQQSQKVFAVADGSDVTPTSAQPRKLNGKFLHITDFHPDEYYQAHSSTEEGIACHRKKGPAGAYGAETTDCDSPLSLVNATFDWISKNVKDQVDFVVWTGDTARHDSDEKLPRAGPQVLDMNRRIANKFVETFSSNGLLEVPIIPTFGNNDFLPHNIFYPGPNRWLQSYSDIWHRFIPEEQRHAFEFGGWFEVEVIPNKLSVFSLNTMYFFDRNAGVDGCALPSEPGFKHMEWLSVQLQRLRERGMKAILIGHVPPARTDSKQNWDETCWQKYTLWLKQFRDVVTGSVYGHMNIDHFLLQDTKEIDLSLVAQKNIRQSIEEDFSVVSKGDYLVELRDSWSDLPGSVIRAMNDDTQNDEDAEYDGDDMSDLRKKKKGKKGKGKKDLKKIGGKFAERYQLSLISPSIVPNYFPTLRIVEYNISGLEDSKVWKDSHSIVATEPDQASDPWEQDDDIEDDRQELKRDLEAENKKKKKGKKGKKKPKDPELVVPADPPKESLPGPAYKNQPFTFVGYTQYFANLTYINNDMTNAIGGRKWRNGDFSDQDPKNKDPQPHKFKFEVEYSTFNDKVFKLPDLTVRSYLELAYRIGKQQKKSGKGKGKKSKGKTIEGDEDFEDDEDLEVFDETSLEADGIDVLENEDADDDSEQPDAESDPDSDSDSGDEVEVDRKGKKNKKKKHKANKVWLHFLQHAFVSTVPKKELKKL